MAYKYDDFVTAANSAGMMNKFTQQDLSAAQKNPEYGLSMLSLMKDYDSSETEEQRLLATEAANQLRKTYGTYNANAPMLPGSTGAGAVSAAAPTSFGASGAGMSAGVNARANTVGSGVMPGSGSVSRTAPNVPGVMPQGVGEPGGGSASATAPVIPGVIPGGGSVSRTAPNVPGVMPQGVGEPGGGSASATAPVVPGVLPGNGVVTPGGETSGTAPVVPGVMPGNGSYPGVGDSNTMPPTVPGATEPGNAVTKGNFNGAYDQQIAEALGLVGNYGEFTYGNEDAYQQMLQKILNPEKFSYDPQTDPRLAAFKKTYLREGDRATANALAQASAATGGVPSSYAATAAAQAGNYYAGQVADVIPQLYNDAYEQYMNDFQMQLSGLGALQDERNFDYQQYMDRYGMLQDNLDNLQEQDKTEYERYLDQWNMDRTEEQDAYDKALAQYEMLGYATPEIAEILGINATLSQKEILALQKAMNSLGANISMDGILGDQTWKAFQNLGYMDAWPAYKAMIEQGLIDAQGNYIGPEIKRSYGGGPRKDGNPGNNDDYSVNLDNFFRNVMPQEAFGDSNVENYKKYLETQAKSMFENGDISYYDYNKVVDKIQGK